jgi:hypothetical protein
VIVSTLAWQRVGSPHGVATFKPATAHGPCSLTGSLATKKHSAAPFHAQDRGQTFLRPQVRRRPRSFERISRSNLSWRLSRRRRLNKLLALHRCQAILAVALITVGLCNPIADCLRRGFELLRQLLRRTTGPYQLDHPPTGFRRTRGCFFDIVDSEIKQMGVHETGSTSVHLDGSDGTTGQSSTFHFANCCGIESSCDSPLPPCSLVT